MIVTVVIPTHNRGTKLAPTLELLLANDPTGFDEVEVVVVDDGSATPGGGPALTALLGGHVDTLASGPAVVIPHIKAGKLRPLAGWGAKRVASLPDVATFKELGYDIEFYIWAGLFAPRGTPAALMKTIREAVKQAVSSTEFKTAMEKIGRAHV